MVPLSRRKERKQFEKVFKKGEGEKGKGGGREVSRERRKGRRNLFAVSLNSATVKRKRYQTRIGGRGKKGGCLF